jgi:hypothetical protein
MSDCTIAKRWIEEEVQSPVEQFMTRVEQACEEFRQAYEEQVEQNIERFEEQTQRVCQSWPWPLNLLCSVVSTLVLVVVKIVVKVVKWLVYTVCKTVTIVTRVVVMAIVRVLKYLAVLGCALGSGQWAEAGQALGGLYTSVVDAAEDLTRDSIKLLSDVAKGVTTDVIGLVADVVGAAFASICTFPALEPEQQSLCRQRVEQVFEGFKKLVAAAADAVTAVVDGLALVVFGIVRFFDVQQISEGLTKIGFGLVFAGVTAARTVTGMFVVDGYREVGHADTLKDCVESLITELVPRELRSRMRAAVGLDVGKVRLTWPVTLTIFYLESVAADPTVNPRALHPTFINLYDLVGGFTTSWPPGFGRPRNEMVIAGTKQRPTRDDIDRYLAAAPVPDTGFFDTRDTSRFRIYPMPRDVLDTHIATAVDKAEQLGLHLVFTVREQPATQWFDARVSTVDDPKLGSGLEHLMTDSLARPQGPPPRCPVAVGALLRDDPVLDPGIFGSTLFSPKSPVSGLEYRDAWPDYVFRYVLIHEIGHYFGLEHAGHTGANHIMWSRASGIPAVSWETVGEAFLSAEPRFTTDDACKVWRWILTNGQACITLPKTGPKPSH